MFFKRLVLAVALACGCAEVDDTATPTRGYGFEARDGSPDDRAADAPSTDGPADVGDVSPADRLGDDVATDVLDVGPADMTPTDVVDAGDASFPDADTDAGDARAPDADTDVVVADRADTGPTPDSSDVPPVDRPDVDTPDVPTDRGDTDASVDVAPDAPADTTPPSDSGDTGPTDTGPADTAPICPTGQRFCGSMCRAIQLDIANCGTCANACPPAMNAAPTCVDGVCGFACNAGFGNCDGNAMNGCEANFATSFGNCGRCGNACASGSSCSGGTCGACTQTVCGMDCVDTRTNASHCSACGNVCTFPNATGVCTSSTCVFGTCNTSFGNCDGNATNGCEADLRISGTNCGACGATCPSRNNAASFCASSACVAECFSGFGDCNTTRADGCEANLRTNALHCGACGNACPSGICMSGVCAPLVEPVLILTIARLGIISLRVRVISGRAPNYVGRWVEFPCLPGSAYGMSCSVDLRRLDIPNGATTPMLFTATAQWDAVYGFEVQPLAGVGGENFCSATDPACGSCGAGAAFSCITVSCFGGRAAGNVRYATCVQGGGYCLRIGGSDLGFPRACAGIP